MLLKKKKRTTTKPFEGTEEMLRGSEVKGRRLQRKENQEDISQHSAAIYSPLKPSLIAGAS